MEPGGAHPFPGRILQACCLACVLAVGSWLPKDMAVVSSQCGRAGGAGAGGLLLQRTCALWRGTHTTRDNPDQKREKTEMLQTKDRPRQSQIRPQHAGAKRLCGSPAATPPCTMPASGTAWAAMPTGPQVLTQNPQEPSSCPHRCQQLGRSTPRRRKLLPGQRTPGERRDRSMLRATQFPRPRVGCAQGPRTEKPRTPLSQRSSSTSMTACSPVFLPNPQPTRLVPAAGHSPKHLPSPL